MSISHLVRPAATLAVLAGLSGPAVLSEAASPPAARSAVASEGRTNPPIVCLVVTVTLPGKPEDTITVCPFPSVAAAARRGRQISPS